MRGQSAINSKLRRPLLITLILCLVAGALLWLDVGGILSPVRTMVGQSLSPVAAQMTRFSNGVGDFVGSFDNADHLRAENERLRQEQSELQAELIKREQALVENSQLRQQLAIEEQQPWVLRGAEVTMRSPDAGRRVITIALGSEDKVDVGMAVVGQTGSGPAALIGVVEEVSATTANVLLMTDFGCRVSAHVLHDGTSMLGLVQGQWQHGSRLRLEHLEDSGTLAEGAIVVSAGLTNELGVQLPMASVPPGVPIGEIEAVQNDGHTQVAELRPYADPDQVRYVWVIVDQK